MGAGQQPFRNIRALFPGWRQGQVLCRAQRGLCPALRAAAPDSASDHTCIRCKGPAGAALPASPTPCPLPVLQVAPRLAWLLGPGPGLSPPQGLCTCRPPSLHSGSLSLRSQLGCQAQAGTEEVSEHLGKEGTEAVRSVGCTSHVAPATNEIAPSAAGGSHGAWPSHSAGPEGRVPSSSLSCG